MRVGLAFATVICAMAVSVLASSARSANDTLADLHNQAIAALRVAEGDSFSTPACNLTTAHVRRDWESLSTVDRKDYISAVKFLMSAPSQSDPTLVPGARNRFDEFAAQHINQTLTIHLTGNFLSWHRYFMYAYETALRDECGYKAIFRYVESCLVQPRFWGQDTAKGMLQYWNWFTYQDALSESPVFDGSDTSMGSNGAYEYHNGSLAGAGTISIPSGEGGGCITSGPFSNITANLGPVSPAMSGMTASNGSLAYNPRCLVRDLSTYTASTWMTTPNLLNLTIGAASTSILTFQDELQGRFPDSFLGLHASGHFAIGGDADHLFSAPIDPAFYMYHTMLDYVYWIWQALHPDEAFTVAGTITMQKKPASRDTRLNDTLGFNYLKQPQRPISTVLNTLGDSPLCYIYAWNQEMR